MNFLLDTHSLLWFLIGDTRLSAQARQLIENENSYALYEHCQSVGNSD